MTEFKSVRLDQLFEKINTKKIKGKVADFPTAKNSNYSIPLLTAGIKNHGFARYAKREDCPTILNDVISISANGANTGISFYQDQEFAILQDAYAIKLIQNKTIGKFIGIFLTASVNKALHGNYDWSNKAGWNNVKDRKISIPVKSNGEIDFAYIEKYIKELEAERIKELEAYLITTGLNDYKLTGDEKQLLAYKPKFKEFKIIDIFSTPGKGDVDLQQSDINGKGKYFINSGETNLGIKGKTDRSAKVFPANTITIDFFGNVYYRDYQYKLATHNHVFSFDDEIIKNKEVALYLVGVLQGLKKKFSYNNMLTWNKLKELSIQLPVKENDGIDFQYMEKYIKAMQKVAIKDVVKYKDKLIETTKKVVND